MPVTVVEPASAAPPAQEMPQLPSQVAEAGHLVTLPWFSLGFPSFSFIFHLEVSEVS
jgi:hypothetical protein